LFASSGGRGADLGLTELFFAEFVLMVVLPEPGLALIIDVSQYENVKSFEFHLI
jgi:hypothetical protein